MMRLAAEPGPVLGITLRDRRSGGGRGRGEGGADGAEVRARPDRRE